MHCEPPKSGGGWPEGQADVRWTKKPTKSDKCRSLSWTRQQHSVCKSSFSGQDGPPMCPMSQTVPPAMFYGRLQCNPVTMRSPKECYLNVTSEPLDITVNYPHCRSPKFSLLWLLLYDKQAPHLQRRTAQNFCCF